LIKPHNIDPAFLSELVADKRLSRIRDADTAFATMQAYNTAHDQSKPLGKRIINFITGQSKLGRSVGNVLDIATVFAPQIGFLRKFLKLRQRSETEIIKKIVSRKMDKPLYKSKGIWGAATIVVATILKLLNIDIPETDVEAILTGIQYIGIGLGIWGVRDKQGKDSEEIKKALKE
jgi:hypothetical protein